MAGDTPTKDAPKQPPPQAPARPSVEVIAFFTTNDTRPSYLPAYAPPAARLDNTKRFKARADKLASNNRVHGVDGVVAATAVVNAVDPNVRFSRVYLIGHGFEGGFFFHGKPDPKMDFTASKADETFKGPGVSSDAAAAKADTDFVEALAKHFKPNDYFEIGILACYSGSTTMVPAVCNHLIKLGFKNFLVGGFVDDYQTRYTFETPSGRILEWTDMVLDKRDEKTILQSMRRGEIPKYQTKCRGPNTPVDVLDP